MAVDTTRDRIRIIHIVFAQEPGASSLLALVCSVGKIPDSLVITSRYWEPSTVATRLGGNACRAVRRDGAGQPTLHSVDDAGDLSTDSVDSFPEYGSSASSPFYSCVALRICDGSLRMVCALESDFPSHSASTENQTGPFRRIHIDEYLLTRQDRHERKDHLDIQDPPRQIDRLDMCRVSSRVGIHMIA